MIKKISLNQLRHGMFVQDMNFGWLQHPFARNRFLVTQDFQIEKMERMGVQELYIDTDRGEDVEEARTEIEVRQELEEKMRVVAMRVPYRPPPVDVKQELQKARTVRAEAAQTVQHVMRDVRMGRQADVEKAEPLVRRITESIFRNPDALMILTRVKLRDTYTFQHSVSVCALLISFLRALGSEEAQIQDLGIGGLLHDIGKMMIPDEVLVKPGPLNGSEFEAMKMHVELGTKLLERSARLSPEALQIVSQHHEHVDGSGYPKRLHGDKISRMGQIASIVDVYDATTSDRAYRKALEPTTALRKLYEWSRHHFNEELVEQFIRAIGIYPVGTLVALESDRLAVVVDRGSGDLLRPVICIVYDRKSEARLDPLRLDLAASDGAGERIVGTESPWKYRIDPLLYL